MIRCTSARVDLAASRPTTARSSPTWPARPISTGRPAAGPRRAARHPRGGQGQRLRPRRRRRRPGTASGRAPTGSPSPTSRRGSNCARPAIAAAILVFGALSVSDVDGVFTHDLTPTVSSPGAAQALGAASRARGTRLRCHLKIDTGLNRLGFRHDNLRRTLPPVLGDAGAGDRGGLHPLRHRRRAGTRAVRGPAAPLRRGAATWSPARRGARASRTPPTAPPACATRAPGAIWCARDCCSTAWCRRRWRRRSRSRRR